MLEAGLGVLFEGALLLLLLQVLDRYCDAALVILML